MLAQLQPTHLSQPGARLDSIALSLPTSLRSFDCTGRALMLRHALISDLRTLGAVFLT
jgi:hypothetical protein